MSKFDEFTVARKILYLPEIATTAVIKSSYRIMPAGWHPDKCEDNKEKCAEMTRKILSAYQTIIYYCVHDQYSFSEDAVKKHQSPEDWRFERFDEDPLRGKSSKS
jgi:DnaJ-class molecular chaperone